MKYYIVNYKCVACNPPWLYVFVQQLKCLCIYLEDILPGKHQWHLNGLPLLQVGKVFYSKKKRLKREPIHPPIIIILVYC
jgi:hypothetical protein